MKNFSCRGLLMVTDELLPKGSHLVMELRLPSSPRGFTIGARVCRIGEYDSGYRYQVAGEFENMDPDDCFVFTDFIAEHVSSTESH